MVFKTGMLYISIVMQILLGSLGQKSTLKDHIELEPSDVKEMLAMDSELEVLKLAPQMLGIMVQQQSSFTNYPQITGYQLTPSNIIVYYDTSFFGQEDEDYYYYDNEPSFYDECGEIVFQENYDDVYYDVEYDNYYNDYYEEPYLQTNIVEFVPLYKPQKIYQR